jgi:hypothetical protein
MFRSIRMDHTNCLQVSIKTLQLGPKYRFFGLRTLFFSKNMTSSLPTSNNPTWREGRWTGSGNHVLNEDHRVFLGGDRQTKCLTGDRQRTVWCLEQDQFGYLRNRRTKYVLSVSCRKPGKLGCRSNSLCVCVVHTTSHVSSEFFTFKCLVGHVCQRCGPVSWKTVGRWSTSHK